MLLIRRVAFEVLLQLERLKVYVFLKTFAEILQ